MVSKIPYLSIVTVGWFVALLFGTLTPGDDLPDIGFNLNDKIIHLIIFLVLTTLFLAAAKRENFLKINSGKIIVTVFLIVSIIAVLTEVLQHFIPGRKMDVSDLIANETGVVTGIIAVRLLYKR